MTASAFYTHQTFWGEELTQILQTRSITTRFQPIVDLKTGQTLGYEALSRGPEGSKLFSPTVLFQCAEETGRLLPLEHLCRETSIASAVRYAIQDHLFLNITPTVIEDPDFQTGLTKKVLFEHGLTPSQIILEITERSAICNFDAFRRSIDHYRRQGFGIAIDDAGAGYSSLQAIAELNPDYIKIDRSIIAGVDQSPLKQNMVKAMVDIAQACHAKIIGEGVETSSELMSLLQLNVNYAQGFYLARPEVPPPVVPDEKRQHIALAHAKKHEQIRWSQNFGLSIGDIVEATPTIAPDEVVQAVETLFESSNYIPGVVVTDGKKPVGLVMRAQLYYHLGSNYGISLYRARPVKKLMDVTPLIVSADLPLEAVARLARERKEANLYDLVIVAREERYIGTVSIMNLLNHLTELQIRCAYHANPLTGLPGNAMIEERLKDLVSAEDRPFAVIYLDLDNFKAFNDRYGFEYGDKALLHTAGLFSAVLAEFGGGNDFLGHIGGDDFIIASTPALASRLCEEIAKRFDREIQRLYPPEDRDKGFISVLNRRGQEEHFPIMTISMAIVTNRQRRYRNFLELGEAAAELKKKAKTYHQSIWLTDARSDS